MADTATTDSANSTEEIKALIDATDTLNESEKEYWLNLLPTMNEGQIEQLRGILETEQENMEEINKKYDQKLEEVSGKYLKRWDHEKAQEARLKMKAEEASLKASDERKAEELLKGY